MTTAVSCSWCHRMNVLPPDGSPVYCPDCRHRGDVCRLDCDCPACAAGELVRRAGVARLRAKAVELPDEEEG